MYVHAVFLLVKNTASIGPGEWGWKTVGNKYVPVMTDEVR